MSIFPLIFHLNLSNTDEVALIANLNKHLYRKETQGLVMLF